jgi:hypothetical protein
LLNHTAVVVFKTFILGVLIVVLFYCDVTAVVAADSSGVTAGGFM